jgi:WD40 repeat protein
MHPSGRRAAVTVAGRGGTRVLTVPFSARGRARPVISGLGRVEGIAWSPDGRWLLVASRDTDQWLLVGPGRRVRPLSGVSGELGAGAGFPGVAGWCCGGG